MTSRDKILTKLRQTRRPFEDIPPAPNVYLPVTQIQPDEDLITRFTHELRALDGDIFVVNNEKAALTKIQAILKNHQAQRVLSWDFTQDLLPDYQIIQPDIHTSRESLQELEKAEVGLTRVAAAIATTGSLIVTGARLPTILPPIHIAVVHQQQLLARLEDWQPPNRETVNVCIITGPSRTADIEKQLVLGVHGPRHVYVVMITSSE
ncbi:MAG: hypothetical protein D6711_15360 [Chloroflexi bacterium]|nr:MAG: hypothetical protein D6711_15360 [Chloroflexota bacterium]